jgi:hypothetical protein
MSDDMDPKMQPGLSQRQTFDALVPRPIAIFKVISNFLLSTLLQFTSPHFVHILILKRIYC